MPDSVFTPRPDGPVLVLGAAGVDIVGRIDKNIKPGTSNPAQIRSSFGGVARNVAENLAHLGQPVILLSVVGTDPVGDQLLQQAASVGVEVDSVIRSSEWPTGSYLAVVNSKGRLEFALDDMRVLQALKPAHLQQQAALFSRASLLFVDANLPKDTLRTAVALARRARLPICADPTSITLASRFLPYLSRLAVITPNLAEAEVLCQRSISTTEIEDVIEAAKCLVSDGVDKVIVTLAQFGLCYATSESSGYVPAIRTEIIDPTGAGDALTAAVLFALLNNIPMDDAVRLGISAATLTLRYRGTVLPDLSLEKLYDQLVI